MGRPYLQMLFEWTRIMRLRNLGDGYCVDECLCKEENICHHDGKNDNEEKARMRTGTCSKELEKPRRVWETNLKQVLQVAFARATSPPAQ